MKSVGRVAAGRLDLIACITAASPSRPTNLPAWGYSSTVTRRDSSRYELKAMRTDVEPEIEALAGWLALRITRA